MANEVERVRKAYRAWNASKGSDIKGFLDLVSDDFVMHSVSPGPGIEFGEGSTGPDRMARYLASILDTWRMEFYEIDTILADGDTVASFGTCSYTSKATGITVTTPIANLWRFRDGKAYELIEIFDSAKAVAAAI